MTSEGRPAFRHYVRIAEGKFKRLASRKYTAFMRGDEAIDRGSEPDVKIATVTFTMDGRRALSPPERAELVRYRVHDDGRIDGRVVMDRIAALLGPDTSDGNLIRAEKRFHERAGRWELTEADRDALRAIATRDAGFDTGGNRRQARTKRQVRRTHASRIEGTRARFRNPWWGSRSVQRGEARSRGSERLQCAEASRETTRAASAKADRSHPSSGSEFEGDALIGCAQASVKFDATLKPTAVGTQGVLMLLEEGLVGSRGGKVVLNDGGSKKDLTALLYVTMFELTAEQQSKLTADEHKELTAQRKLMAESLLKTRERFKEQGWVTVERCEFPNRTPLGTCVIEDAGKTFAWSLAFYHFDVKSTSDSDSGMKNCLSTGGEWTVAEGQDAAMERAKQHSQQLHKRLEKHSKDLKQTMKSLSAE